jgi:transposase
MRKIKELLRLKWESGLSDRQVAVSCAVSRSTVSAYVRRARAAGLSWPVAEALSEEELARRLFPPRVAPLVAPPLPDWVEVHRELKRKGVTHQLLWLEYKDQYPDGLQYR